MSQENQIDDSRAPEPASKKKKNIVIIIIIAIVLLVICLCCVNTELFRVIYALNKGFIEGFIGGAIDALR